MGKYAPDPHIETIGRLVSKRDDLQVELDRQRLLLKKCARVIVMLDNMQPELLLDELVKELIEEFGD